MKHYSKKLIYLTVITGFIVANFSFAKGDSLELNSELPLNFSPLDTLNSAGIKSIGAGEILKGFDFKFPFNFDPKSININTNIPASPLKEPSQDPLPDGGNINLKQFLTPKDVSSDDFVGAIKAIVALIIEIFLAVISLISQILRLILEFLR